MTGLIVAVVVVGGAFAFWGVMRLEERYDPRHDTAPIPLIVPGRGTPAVHLTAIPPAVSPAAVTHPPAGGSNVPAVLGNRAGTTLAPGPGCLPEGDAPGSRPPQEAPGREPDTGPLFPDWPTGDFAAVIDALGDPS